MICTAQPVRPSALAGGRYPTPPRHCAATICCYHGSDPLLPLTSPSAPLNPAPSPPRIQPQVRMHFRPEFVNRIDEFIVFQGLRREQIKNIVTLQVGGGLAAARARHAKLRRSMHGGDEMCSHRQKELQVVSGQRDKHAGRRRVCCCVKPLSGAHPSAHHGRVFTAAFCLLNSKPTPPCCRPGVWRSAWPTRR